MNTTTTTASTDPYWQAIRAAELLHRVWSVADAGVVFWRWARWTSVGVMAAWAWAMG